MEAFSTATAQIRSSSSADVQRGVDALKQLRESHVSTSQEIAYNMGLGYFRLGKGDSLRRLALSEKDPRIARLAYIDQEYGELVDKYNNIKQKYSFNSHSPVFQQVGIWLSFASLMCIISRLV